MKNKKVSNNLSLYEKSNSIESICITFSDKVRVLYRELLLCCDDAKVRQLMANKLCIELCKCFGLKQVVELRVCNVPQDSRTVNGVCVSKTSGKYIHSQNMIVVFNKTAVRKQIVSIKVFSDTLLHEFAHYLDHSYYRFNESIHTSGFYKRIFDLKEKLKT